MKKNTHTVEFLYQLGALIVITIIIHASYASMIRPRADAHLKMERELMQQDEGYIQERNFFVLIRDYEQEACFILAFWALAIIVYKGSVTIGECKLMQESLIPLDEGMRILPEDSRELSRRLEAFPEGKKKALLPRALLAALHRFDSARNIQDVACAAHTICESEGERLESELSMIRYIAWAIPSVGFIGTVRGIGEALGYAHTARTMGDMSFITQSLGVAFNSTLIALLISIVLMFVVHQLQLLQERYVLDAEAYCEENLIRHLHTR
jgi:biopolymer transport protein ExbB/TolQ